MEYYSLPHLILNEKNVDPFILIKQFFENATLPVYKRQINEIMMAAFSENKATWIIENPDNMFYKYEQFNWLITACYILTTNKEITHTRLFYSNDIRTQIQNELYQKVQCSEGFYYPQFLTPDECRSPYDILKTSFKQITFQEWKLFLYEITSSALNHKHQPFYREIENAIPCYLLINKILEAVYLIHISEINS